MILSDRLLKLQNMFMLSLKVVPTNYRISKHQPHKWTKIVLDTLCFLMSMGFSEDTGSFHLLKSIRIKG